VRPVDVDVAADGTEHGPGERHGRVRVRRRYPVLSCGLPPESATKTAPELELR